MLPFPTVWMDLENITLSEISQSEKDKYQMIYSYVDSNEQTELTAKDRMIDREQTDSSGSGVGGGIKQKGKRTH